ncbi:thymidylate kinase [archaeon BMS3Abin17]|nr:thymidylate kinase [archaeon BMS3Abin17]HDZ60247.1 thymidylate kinase [Candidatus Pacearchaeota archaeon]
MKRGKIIEIEGTDSSGKETQSKLLLKRLKEQGISIEMMSFPQYKTPTGRIVGQCYLGKGFEKMGGSWFGDSDSLDPLIASLYYAGDRKYAMPKIEDILNSGTNLIFDRWVESNMGHQGGKAKNPKERIKIIEFINKLEYDLLELPKPDHITFLYMPTEVAIKLREKRDIKRAEKPDGHENNIEHLKRAEQTYLQLAEKYRWNKIDCTLDGTIKTLKSEEDIGEEVYRSVEQKIFSKIIL